jgi:hypothetical protein
MQIGAVLWRYACEAIVLLFQKGKYLPNSEFLIF